MNTDVERVVSQQEGKVEVVDLGQISLQVRNAFTCCENEGIY